MSEKKVLLVMARPPELGKVKTRLAAEIGPEKTLRIYEALLDKVQHTLETVDAHIHIHWTNLPYPAAFDNFMNTVQCEGDLGEKMLAAFQESASPHANPMVMIGTDCYDLESETIRNAFEALTKVDVVIGPAMDGGYYLIGMKKVHHALFRSMPWSTSQLLTNTIQCMRNERLSFILLPALRDIDEVTDAMATADLRAYLI